MQNELKFFYTADLHDSIRDGVQHEENDKGAYIVAFRVLQKDSNKIVYNKIYYPEIYVNCLMKFLFMKSNFTDSLTYREFGDYLTVVDKSFITSADDISQSIKENKNNLYLQKYLESISSYDDIGGGLYGFFDFIKKHVIVKDDKDVTGIMELLLQKRFSCFVYSCLGIHIEDNYYNKFDVNELYLLKDCIFIVRDLDNFLGSIKNIDYDEKTKYELNRGPTKYRDSLNSLTTFLSYLDSDFRDYLYQTQKYLVNNGHIPKLSYLPKSMYSYRNIQQKIGSRRYYSTSRLINKKVYSTVNNKNMDRQILFENSYNKIGVILKNNYFVNSEKVQTEIENLLSNQETIYQDSLPSKSVVKYTTQSYEVLNKKHIDLCKFLSNPDKVNPIKMKSGPNKLVFDIVDTLGVNNISSNLLSFFITIFSQELLISDVNKIAGVSTIECYDKFGKIIFNKYVSKLYQNKKKNGIENETFTNCLNSVKKKYSNEFDEYSSYSLIGAYFVWKLKLVKLIYEEKVRNPENYKQTILVLRVVDKIRAELVKEDFKPFHLPQRLPMVCPPKDYVYSSNSTDNKLGGYLLNDVNSSDSLIRDKKSMKKQSSLLDDNIVTPMANFFMKIPYKINIDTLNFIKKYGITKNILIDNSDEEFNKFVANPYARKYSQKGSNNYRSLYSKLLLQNNILGIADTYSSMEKIYFPVRLCFRGRVYCNTDYLDFQKSDLAKGLLLFANPGFINKGDSESIKYFKAFGANMYGDSLDKKSLNYRVKWVDENSDKLLDFENNDIILKAENKVCFISFCYEYSRFIKFINNKDSAVFSTYLPIQLDASCNGYQHLALLTQESKLLGKLNLGKSTHDEDPNDFYSYLDSLIYKQIESNIKVLSDISDKNENQVDLLEKFNKLISVKFNRSIIKKIIMTESYNASIPTLIDNVLLNENITQHGFGKDTYYTYINNDTKLSRSDISLYIKTLKQASSILAPKINNLSKYLDSVATICTMLNTEIPWGTPSGLRIPQSYLKQEKKNLVAFTFTKSKYTFKKFLDEIDLKDQKNAIRPNLIHSLDASTIALLCNSLPKYVDLYTVHDCFAVTANNVPLLINKLKLIYMKLYSDNKYLSDFDKKLRLDINYKFGNSVFELNGNTINIIIKDKMKTLPFPDVNSIIGTEEPLNGLLDSSYIII